MNQHQINEATFTLPTELKDKTVHMFVTSEDGPNEFNVVISRANLEAEEHLEHFKDRLVAELERALPIFELTGSIDRTLSDIPAIEIIYRWNNDGIRMHQRQVITASTQGDTDAVQALMIAATCPKPFSDHWNQVFDDLLDSIRLRQPFVEASDVGPQLEDMLDEPTATAPTDTSPTDPPYIFALAVRDRLLHIFDNEEEACRLINPIEVEDRLWEFFDCQGNPLKPDFVQPNTGIIWRSGGKYLLRECSATDRLPLSLCMDRIRQVRGKFPMNSIPAIERHFERLSLASSITMQNSDPNQ
ncbi:DcrB-related protein [Noviherbaspirillum saxi]|uniref:DUF1795 domain-containing protein n=1 Tax=Noviherbaspirillum saxi TaxID=2320863 RepID=A0A3A3GEY2_9BURK|nr:DcrB-related protein [Noviherbaspirillum saxi]RJF99469.1 DUF1795 domain-containing protein [Noviherbaspirillum saxi]